MRHRHVVTVAATLAALWNSATPIRAAGPSEPPPSEPTTAAASTTPSDQAAGRNWLALIAIRDYPNVRPLVAPVRDALALKEVLLGRYAFSQDATLELYDAKATNKAILDLFRQLQKKVGPKDSLLLFYAGHGYLDEAFNVSYWVPFDGTPDHERWVVDTEIKGFVQNMKAKHVLLIADSCFSGKLLGGERDLGSPEFNDEQLSEAYSYRSRQVMTSGRISTVRDTGFGEHSPFAENLIRVLQNSSQPVLDVQQLYLELRRGIQGQQPLLGTLVESGQELGGSFLFLQKGILPPPPPLPVAPPTMEPLGETQSPLGRAKEVADDSEAAIRDTLNRWRKAYESLDLPTLRKVWPDCPWSLEKTFRGIRKNTIEELAPPTIELDSGTAKVSWRFAINSVRGSGSGTKRSTLATFQLRRKGGGSWEIVSYAAKEDAP